VRHRPPLGAALLAGLLAASGRGQETAPSFGVETSLVAVDVTVLDARGRPLPDLAAADFALSVDGKPRRVASAEFIALGGASAPPPTQAGPPRQFSDNAGATRGRLVLIAVDQGSIRSGSIRDVTLAADRLLDRMGAADRVGLVAFPPPGPSVEPTADLALVRKALGRVVGRKTARPFTNLGLADALAQEENPSLWRDVEERECPSTLSANERDACLQQLRSDAIGIVQESRVLGQATTNRLRALFEALQGIGGPKTLVLISQGLGLSDPSDVRGLGRLAAEAQVALYVLRLDRDFVDASQARATSSASDDRLLSQAGLDQLAASARGTVFGAAGSGEGVFDRIARELTGYYLVGFEPEPGDRDSRDHDLRVRVGAPGVTVRARRSVRIPAPGAEPGARQRLTEALRSPFVAPDVALRVATWSTRADGPGLRLLLEAELGKDDAPPPAALAYVVLDAKGEVAASGFRELAGARRFLGAAQVPPGHYTLKLAALDARGRIGSVSHELEAGLRQGGGLEASDLILGDPAAAGGAHPSVAPQASGGRISAHLELYGDPARVAEAAVAFEVAETDDGPALVSGRAGGAPPPPDAPSRRALEATLAVQLLPPGDYVARAVVSSGDRRDLSVTRRFSVPRRPSRSAGGTGAAARISAGEIRGALPAFERAQALQPALVGYLLDRMDALSGPPADAATAKARADARASRLEPVFGDLAGVTADRLDVALLRGLSFLAKGELRAAESQLKLALRHSSELVAAAIPIGACYAAAGQDAEAIGAWQTALAADADAPGLRVLLAEALLRGDEPDEAAALLAEERAARPDADLDRDLGLADAMRGRRAEALAELASHLERRRDDSGALFVTLRLAFEAYAEGEGSDPFAGDRARLIGYAKAYVAAQGPQHELVASWLRHLAAAKP
jgi:VWFA-related protein